MTAFRDKIRQSLEDWSKLTSLPSLGNSLPKASILVALSGGADSVALLVALHEMQQEFDLSVQAAHFNHELRGEESEADSKWVQQLCESIGINCSIEKASQAQNETQIKSEESARTQRYKFLIRTARETKCITIFFAHHKDDQVETILHHIIRGTGLRGLRGIPQRRDLEAGIELYRPMLSIRKDEILKYLESIEQDYREDSSNSSSDFTRNKLRIELLPLLRSEFNPAVDDAIVNLGKRSADAEEIIQLLIRDLLDQSVLSYDSKVCKIAMKSIQLKPASLLKEFFIQLWIDNKWPRKKMGEDEWSLLAKIAKSENDQSIDITGGLRVEKRGHLMSITQL